MHTPTVTLCFSQALLQAAERLGIPAPAQSPDSDRVPLAVQDQLWQHLATCADDPLIGLHLGLTLQVGHLDVTGMLLMSCDTYVESLEVLCEYLPIIGEGGEVDVKTQDQQIALSYAPIYDVCRAQGVEAVFGAILQLSRWSTGGRFSPSSVHFEHAALDKTQRYSELLGCPVHFECTGNYLSFSCDQLDMPLIQANSTLRDQLRLLADNTLRELGDASLSAEVAALIRQHPRAGKERIAELLAMSGRHLNRRLADEGVSFKQLRDRELRILAEAALHRDEKVVVIADALGFSDESAFARAFRRWSGMTPSQFREQ